MGVPLLQTPIPPKESLVMKALRLSSETSEKYVITPSRSIIQQDLLIGLKRFKNTCRWREFWMLKTDEDDDSTVCSIDINGKKIITTGDLLHSKKYKFSLSTNLKGKQSKRITKRYSRSRSLSTPSRYATTWRGF